MTKKEVTLQAEKTFMLIPLDKGSTINPHQLSVSKLLRFIACVSFVAALSVSVAAQLASPNQPVFQDPHNNRYVIYQSHPMVLVGASGEYLPHVNTNGLSFFCPASNPSCIHNPSHLISSAYCTYDTVPTDTASTIKAKRCIDILNQNHLNLMRLWISLDSSPGTAKTTPSSNPVGSLAPYLHEQPFVWNTSLRKWNLNSLDIGSSSFFSNLVDIVSYAQTKGVVVEVTLFDPWGPRLQDSPYQQGNQSPVIGQFSPNALFAQGENCTPASGLLDCSTANINMRARQVAVLTQVVTALYPYFNVYYELANEADFTGNDQPAESKILAWHNYMVTKIRDLECNLGGASPGCVPSVSWYRHMVAANFAGPSAIAGTQNSSTIRMINGHYARIVPGSNPLPANPVSALNLVQTYNTYTNGVQNSNNNMIWGFNESQLLGFDFPARTADSARAEAWEFLLNGGGVYDLYAYDWGNLNSSFNNSESTKAIAQMGVLSSFVNTLPNLEGMKHMDNGNKWISVAPYGTADSDDPGGQMNWAAMQDGVGTWLFYIHHSTVSGDTFARYVPQCHSNCAGFAGTYQETFTISNLNGCSTANYQATWLDPRTAQVMKTEASWPQGTTKSVQTPPYSYDVVLRIQSNCPILIPK
jgi:hypothetical protein